MGADDDKNKQLAKKKVPKAKGGKAAAPEGAGNKRHAKKKEGFAGIRQPTMKRLARRGGCKRITTALLETLQTDAAEYLGKLVRSVLLMNDQKTVRARHVAAAVRNTDGRQMVGMIKN
jgi:histone H3/H4